MRLRWGLRISAEMSHSPKGLIRLQRKLIDYGKLFGRSSLTIGTKASYPPELVKYSSIAGGETFGGLIIPLYETFILISKFPLALITSASWPSPYPKSK